MLNVFMPFTNTFLRLLFFLAGLIPQLLQKSRTHDPAAKGEWAANASGMSRPCAAGTPPGGKPDRAAGGG